MLRKSKIDRLLVIINQVRENIGLETLTQISPDMKFKEDLDIDSISMEELVVYVEEATDVELDIETIKTVDDILNELTS